MATPFEGLFKLMSPQFHPGKSFEPSNASRIPQLTAAWEWTLDRPRRDLWLARVNLALPSLCYYVDEVNWPGTADYRSKPYSLLSSMDRRTNSNTQLTAGCLADCSAYKKTISDIRLLPSSLMGERKTFHIPCLTGLILFQQFNRWVNKLTHYSSKLD